MKINLKRIYQAKENSDGFRILVDKIYPRGIKRRTWMWICGTKR